MAEEHLHDHFPGYPVMPHPLIIEGVAQTGGLLVAEHNAFLEKVVLAKISKAKFHGDALPGDILTYTTDIEYIPAAPMDISTIATWISKYDVP